MDNESSLKEVVRKIDGFLDTDEIFVFVFVILPLKCDLPMCCMLQRRNISEREARMRGLRADYNMVLEQSAQSMVPTSCREVFN